MNKSDDGKPPVPLEPEVLSLWKKVFPRLAHYFTYPEPPYTRDFDDYGQKRPGGRPAKPGAKTEPGEGGKTPGK